MMKLVSAFGLPAVTAFMVLGTGAAKADSIELCGGLYRYIDFEFMRARMSQGCMGGRWPRAGEALGWTLSATPPDANVEWIDEVATVCFGLGPEKETIVSRGRKVPRYRVTGKSHEFGNYVTQPGTSRRESCQSVEYKPPATSRRPSAEEIERFAPIVFGPVREGPIESTPASAVVGVGRKLLQLYGVASIPGQQGNAWRLLANQHARCREVDLGGYQCLVNGEDLSKRLAAEGLVTPHSTATPSIRAVAGSAPTASPSAPARPDPLERRCKSLSDAVERNQRMAEGNPRYANRLERAQETYRKACGG